MSPLEVLEEAERREIIAGISDHNIIAAIRALMELADTDPDVAELMRQHLIPGVEIQAREGAELLIYGNTPTHLDDFYRKEIEEPDLLDKREPIYEPIDIGIVDLAKQCRKWEMDIVVPHYGARHYGIGSLPRDVRKELNYELRAYHGHVCVERNPYVSRFANLKAITYAHSRKNRFPVIATSDNHNRRHGSYTEMTLPPLGPDQYRSEQIFSAIHKEPPSWEKQHLERVPLLKAIRNTIALFRQGGWSSTKCILMREVRHHLGLPASTNSSSREQPQETLQTADVDDAVGS
jgi:hypothetical protein